MTQSMRTYSQGCFRACPVTIQLAVLRSLFLSLGQHIVSYCVPSVYLPCPQRESARQGSLSTLRRSQAWRSTAPEVDGLSPTVVSLDSNVQLEVSDRPSLLSLHELLSAVGQRVREEMQSITGVQRLSQSSGHSLTQDDSQRLFQGNVYSQAAGSAVQQPLPFTEDSRGVLNGGKKALPCVCFFNP